MFNDTICGTLSRHCSVGERSFIHSGVMDYLKVKPGENTLQMIKEPSQALLNLAAFENYLTEVGIINFSGIRQFNLTNVSSTCHI